jgi:outer membrane receptor for Fe3+-dicitrate
LSLHIRTEGLKHSPLKIFVILPGIRYRQILTKQNRIKQSDVKVKNTVDSFTSGDIFGLNKVLPAIAALMGSNRKK